MKPLAALLLAVVVASAATSVAAQEASSEPPARIEPAVRHAVIEDDHVQIDELRVRGQNQRLQVRIKKGLPGRYEVLPEGGARDPSLPAGKGVAGQRVWQVLAF